MNYICPHCSKDLTEPVKLFGIDVFDYHLVKHEVERNQKEIIRLRTGIEELRDGGFGCAKEAQALLDGGQYE